MNLGGGASNVDLSEAARLLKQNTGGAGVPNQQVPPPMMLMQQAVAMQQFQFQQALLMQQVMATQQAAARAATVKSAQEMAAARAAEISKQLKGNEPDAEEEKKSPGRSKSRTPSRSRSRSGSLSRSKSRSPLRYRRDRSASRSPLRYRRDSRPSPSRSRDYYSYRSRSRRGYYRGRGDYPWNSSFRRDWDRDRDHYSSRGTRRSRSRSRSRVRRRSRTRSRSPRSRRDRSVTPPRYGRDERRVGRSSRRSRSRETKPSPSHSSRSRSESLHREDASRSPPRKSRGVGSGGGSRKGDSLSPVPKSSRRALCPSPALKDHKERLDVDDLSDSKGGDATERSSPAKKCISGPLTSPARSLSDSLSSPERFGEKFVEVVPDDNGQSGWKKNNLQDTSGWKTDGVSSVENLRTNQSLSGWASGAGVSVAEEPHEQESGPKSAIKGKSGEFIGRQARQARKESSGKLGYQSEGDSDGGGDEIDDWRDDIKGHEREKAKRKDIKLEAERREEEKKGMLAEVTVVKEVGGPAVILLEHIGKGSGKVAEEATIVVPEAVQDLGAVFKTGNDMTGLDYVNVEAKISKIIDENLSKQEFLKEESNRKGHTKGGEEDEEVSVIAAIPKDDAKGKSSDFTEGPDFETEVNVVFEGPKPAYDEVPAPTAGGTYKKANDLPKDLSRKHHGSSKVDEDIVEIGAQQLPTAREEEDLIRSHKGKEKLKSRERSRRHEDDVDRNRRKDRHRKHKRKHRRDEEIEKEEDDDDDHGGDGEGGKDKEERQHRSSKKHRSRDNGDRRDRKKRRHRHRGKSATISPEKDSVLAKAEGAQDVDDVPKAVYKKHSSGHEKRRKAVSKSPASGSASD